MPTQWGCGVVPFVQKARRIDMGKKERDKLQGESGFQSYYSQLYGQRWPGLYQALLKESEPVAWQTEPGRPAYYLDSASIRAAVSLPLEGASSLLDLCAAPGGKTLVISSLMEEDACLLSNERSRERLSRLHRVADQHMSESVRHRVTISGKDGATLCRNPANAFDRILLDAPCSSERHVLASPRHLEQWSPARIKTLAVAQWALLSSAYRMLKPGGYMVYATCALSPEENDTVVARLEGKFPDVELVRELPPVPAAVTRFCSAPLPKPEVTERGFHVLPDWSHSHGGGPLYFSLIHKKFCEETE